MFLTKRSLLNFLSIPQLMFLFSTRMKGKGFEYREHENSIMGAGSSSHTQIATVLMGFLWSLYCLPGWVDSVPIPILHAGKELPAFFESQAYNLMEKATGLHTNNDQVQKARVFPRRNMWELLSSSSDVIPIASRGNNSSFSQWLGGGGGMMMTGHSLSQPQLSIETRLEKLQHHFNSLRVYDEDCRLRMLCEIAESPPKFAPLTSAFLDETSFNGDEKSLASKLLETNEGTKLLTYIEATQRGSSRQGCEIWTYRCPRSATAMIDFKALLVWREMSKWLTVKFVANKKHH